MLLLKLQVSTLIVIVVSLVGIISVPRADPRVLNNPTMKELLIFLSKDQTHLVKYDTNGTYTCFMFARDFKIEANTAGLQCAACYVIYYEGLDGSNGHFVNAFNVSDSYYTSAFGLTFVEPQSATIIRLNVGTVYLNHTVLDLSVIW